MVKRRRFYNVRDLLGHWVKPRSLREKMCPHACCRGKRVHPANFPVILPKQLLRQASDTELADHYGKHAHNGNARRQIEAEMVRRDRRKASASRATDRARARASDRAAAKDALWLRAERATNGNLVNARGRKLGISDRRVLTNARDAERYGTRELVEFLESERKHGGGHRLSRQRTYRGAA